jgi:hypothetical protein
MPNTANTGQTAEAKGAILLAQAQLVVCWLFAGGLEELAKLLIMRLR